MSNFCPLFAPVGVGTFHMETAHAFFQESSKLLQEIDPEILIPEDILLSVDRLKAWLKGKTPDLIIFQNNTFANAAYMAEVLRMTDCPVLLWTLREPKGDGGRLRLNSLTGAYSAANIYREMRDGAPLYVFGSPEEASVRTEIEAAVRAARLRKELRSLRVAAVGQTPQGFGFGRALDQDLASVFGAELLSIEVRELIDRAKGFSPGDSKAYLEKSALSMTGLDKTPEKNLIDYGRLYRAYDEFVKENGIGALASRCWPDLFTSYGTPNCAVLSMLNDDGVAAACEADVYGALSMWMGRARSSSATRSPWMKKAIRSLTGTAAPARAPWPERTPARRSACTRTGRSARPWTSAAKASGTRRCSASDGNRTAVSASSSSKERRWTARSSTSGLPSSCALKKTRGRWSRTA